MDDENCINISNFSFEVINRELAPLTPIIYNVVETAQVVVPACIETFMKKCTKNEEHIPEKINNWLYPSLMRAIMQVLLHSQDVRTQILFDNNGNIENIRDWNCVILSNNGLAGMFEGYNYRILKATSGNLPPAGISFTRQRFYCQDHLKQYRLRLDPYDNADNMQKPNIIYLWDSHIDSPVSLYISCPKWGTPTRAEAYFTEPVEHPILAIPSISVQDIVEDIQIEKLIPELDVSPKDKGKRDLRE